MCKIKYFICNPVSVTKKLRHLQAKIKMKYPNNFKNFILVHCSFAFVMYLSIAVL